MFQGALDSEIEETDLTTAEKASPSQAAISGWKELADPTKAEEIMHNFEATLSHATSCDLFSGTIDVRAYAD